LKKSTSLSILIIMLVGLLAFPVVLFSTELRDADKKRIVYQMFAEYSKGFSSVKVLSPEKAMALAESKNLVIVDVRQENEMRISVLPGAITQKKFLGHIGEYKNKTIMVYCTIGYRSGKFAQKMKDMDIDVYNLKGGILAWALEGGKVYDSSGIIRRIHVYGKKWKYVPDGYESVMNSFFEYLFK